jgi:type I restriction enzyme R subunit
MAPFNAKGGLGKMHQLFGTGMNDLIDELNEALAV